MAMYTVTIPQWTEGLPLHIRGIEAQSPSEAIDKAIEKLQPLYQAYNQSTPIGMRKVMTAKKEVAHSSPTLR